MKIGIVTYHRTLNYGAVMQSLATRFALEEMGHEVYYVDYWPDYHRRLYECFSFRRFVRCIFKFHAVSYLKMSVWKKRRHDNFDVFFKRYIYPYCRPIDENYDVVIYGSDQIWRKQIALRTYNPFYFGKNDINTKHHVSYAASMGILPDNGTDKANELCIRIAQKTEIYYPHDETLVLYTINESDKFRISNDSKRLPVARMYIKEKHAALFRQAGFSNRFLHYSWMWNALYRTACMAGDFPNRVRYGAYYCLTYPVKILFEELL